VGKKWTPGPWEYRLCVEGDEGIYMSGNLLSKVASLSFTHSEIMDANGALIAAAPDLVEALEMVEDHLYSFPDDDVCIQEDRALVMRALAKAHGEDYE